MRLVCRECSAIYEAPDTLFGAQPREVRCNRCGYQWTVVGAVKAVPGAGQPLAAPQPVAPAPLNGQTETPAAGGMPPELLRDAPAAPPQSPSEPPSRDVAAPLPPTAASPAPPARNSTLADKLAGSLPARTPDPEAAQPAPSTRSLLARDGSAMDLEMGDPEERRLSHELSFGETERAPVTAGQSRSGLRGLWLVLLLLIVLAIAAILFEPQILGAVPALSRVYRALGL